MSKSTDRYDVLIAGAGPVGLAAAIELGSRGNSCLVVERNDRVGYAPRATSSSSGRRRRRSAWARCIAACCRSW